MINSRLVLFVLIAVLALTLGFWSFSPATAVNNFRYGGYVLVLGASLLFGYHLARLIPWRSLGAIFRRGGWRVLLLVGLATGFLHTQERHGFKIVMDEVVQLSTSKRLHETREAAMVGRGYPFGSKFVPMQGLPDKRPLFYPFLLSLLHDFSGFRAENAFLLNGLLTPLLLWLVFAVAQRVSGPGGGLASVLLLISLPLLAQTVTGGGFEVLNLVMIALTVLLGMNYAENPRDDVLSGFCLSGVLLAQVRYESVLLLLPVAVVVIWTWWRTRRIQLPWAVIFCPLLLLAYPWQFQLMKLHPRLWQLADRPSEHGVFSVSYFYDNVGRALNYFVSYDRTMANSHLVAVAGTLGVGFFWLILYREHRTIFRAPAQAVFMIFCLALSALALLLLCYFWGAMDDVVTVRLSLPMQVLMVWSFVYAWPKLVPHAKRWAIVVIACSVYLFVWTIPTLHKRAYSFENLAAENVNWLRSFIREQLPAKSFVLDSNSLLLWIASDVPGLTLDALADRREAFLYHYRRRTFEHYFVVQRMVPANFTTGEWKPVDAHEYFAAAVDLEPVAQAVYNPLYAMRISRIVSIDESRFADWAERRLALAKMKSTSQVDGPANAEVKNSEEPVYVQEWLRNLP